MSLDARTETVDVKGRVPSVQKGASVLTARMKSHQHAVESDELSVIAVEEEVQSSGNSYLYEEEDGVC